MNKRNFKHGMSETSLYYCWQNLKRHRGGVCLSWRDFATFVTDIGYRPSPAHWLFRTRAYQRSRPGNVEWRAYARPFRDIWQYLTPTELIACHIHIKGLCERGGYDYDAGINELYLQNLEGVADPCARIHSWVKRYLPRILAGVKKQRGKIRYSEEVKYG